MAAGVVTVSTVGPFRRDVIRRVGLSPLRADRRCHDAVHPPTCPRPIGSSTASPATRSALMLRSARSMTVEGLENIPETGAAIIAPNHLSVHDSTVLLGVLPRMIAVHRQGRVRRRLDHTLRVPRARQHPRRPRRLRLGRQAALDAAAGVLEAGDMFGIFPEGTRSRDGLLHKGKTGVARLALRTGAPIIPCGLIGTDEMQTAERPDHRDALGQGSHGALRRAHPRRPLRQRGPTRRVAPRQMTDDLMYEISQLSGQTYVDEYMMRPDQVAEAKPDESGGTAEQAPHGFARLGDGQLAVQETRARAPCSATAGRGSARRNSASVTVCARRRAPRGPPRPRGRRSTSPTTTDVPTPGCTDNAISTSAGDTLKPLMLMTSFLRSTMSRRPSSSNTPMSPVRSQPSLRDVERRTVEVAASATEGPRTHTSPKSPSSASSIAVGRRRGSRCRPARRPTVPG